MVEGGVFGGVADTLASLGEKCKSSKHATQMNAQYAISLCAQARNLCSNYQSTAQPLLVRNSSQAALRA